MARGRRVNRADALVQGVSARLAFNARAYGTPWNGEDEDTEFVCSPLLDEIERYREALERGCRDGETDEIRAWCYLALHSVPRDRGRPRPETTGYCKTCLGPHNSKPLSAQETISPRGIVHYGKNYGLTLCGKAATGDGWWWPL